MAKITYGKALGEMGFLGTFYPAPEEGNAYNLVTSTTKKAVFESVETGATVVLKGKGLAYEDGVLTAGTVDGMLFSKSDGTKLATFTDGGWTYSESMNAINALGFPDRNPFEGFLFGGNDTMIGSKRGDLLLGSWGKDKIDGRAGDDRINGGSGKDVLTGGEGSDTFIFSTGFGRDIIKDFDAKGGGDKQDYLNLFGLGDFDVIKKGKNLILEFEDNDRLTLIDVKLKDFNANDYPSEF